ncbi:MAG TPA: polysaccharide deacetylase family protein [Burkholderiales bacterium]|nr:polysaccharide deacetylase family protein [Burkholderiales bacterium]
MSHFLLKGLARYTLPGGEKNRLGVLIYHRVLREADALVQDTVANDFDWQLQTLKRCFNVLPLPEALDRLQQGELPPGSVAITFDDGYADNATVALPLLKRHGLHATFFIASGFLDGGRMWNDSVVYALRNTTKSSIEVPALQSEPISLATLDEKRSAIASLLPKIKYIPEPRRSEVVQALTEAAGAALPDDLMMSSAQVRELRQAGMEIGGHTITHPILALVPEAEASEQIGRGREILQGILGEPISLFAYPNGVPKRDYLPAHIAAVKAAGFKAAFSTAWGAATRHRDPFQLPRFTPWDKTPARFALRLALNGRKTEARAV